MKRLLSLPCFFLFAFTSFAQQNTPSVKAEYYSDNIIKVTFTLSNWHGENVSDAVILKPLKNKKVKLDHIFKEERILINGKIDITLFDSANYRGLIFPLQPGEKFFGGGERALPLNRRGYRLTLNNNPWYGYGEGADQLNYSVPFITSSNGYALFFDNPSKGFIDIGKTNPGQLRYAASSGEINVYVIFGDYQTTLQSYYKLTGTQPLPPRWALGNLMSRFGYTSEVQAKEIYGKMKGENIPVDAIIFDLFWFGDSIKGTLGNLDWVNKQKWPNPKKMISDFKKDGVQTILVTEPFFVETSKNYRASKPYLAVDSTNKPYYLNDFYFGKGGLIDIFRKDAQSWFWQFYKKQMLNGVEAWWGDLGEPERHPSNMYHNLQDLGQKRMFAANEVHNLYGHAWTKMLFNFYAKEYPNKRLFSLNRSGFAGTQRYSIFPWTGDVSRSWSGLRAQLPVLLGMSMSGIPYVHSDAGGFAGGEGDPELYVRWLQFAAFTPIFRPHGTALYEVDKGAFSFPSEAALIEEPFRENAKLAIGLRYSFMPYNYSLAYQQTKYGKPLIAPLYYHFPNDTTAVDIQDEYMWGENLLIAPILEKGMKQRRVYLPQGQWQDIANKTIDGGQWITVPATMEFIPIFIRSGSFIPALATDDGVMNLPNSAGYNKVPAFLGYFPSTKKTIFEWYEDDGSSKNAMAGGNHTVIQCAGQALDGKIIVTITPSNNQFLKQYLTLSVSGISSLPKKITVNGQQLPVTLDDEPRVNKNAVWIQDVNSVQVKMKLKNQKQIRVEITK